MVVMVELYHQVISLVVELLQITDQEPRNGTELIGQKPLFLVREMEMLVDVPQLRYTVMVLCIVWVINSPNTMLVYVQKVDF